MKRLLANAMTAPPIDQHLVEIQRNRQSWEQKPLLRIIYRRFYGEISRALKSTDGKGVLELGSGIGAIKSTLPDCTTSDIFPNPWLDRTEDAYAIQMPNASLSGLILFDVWHHLEFPVVALKEFSRVVRPGGRVVLFEPAMGVLGRIIYGCFHHEPLKMNESIAIEPPAGGALPSRYYAAQGNCWRAFYKQQMQNVESTGFRMVEIRTYSAISYVGAGGFSKPQLYPRVALRWIEKLESVVDRWPKFFATRMLVCLERIAAS